MMERTAPRSRADYGAWARGRGVVTALAAGLAVLSACSRAVPDSLSSETYPSSSVEAGEAVFAFGPGRLETTDDSPWGGIASVVYPVVWDTRNSALQVEIHGLDLSGIEYTGDMGWPPDGTDTGALFQAVLEGSSRVSLRAYSSLAAFDSEGTLDHRDGLRAYQFSGFNDNQGPYGLHQMDVQRHEAEGSSEAYETFDLRLRYEGGSVEAWVRAHASRAWDDDESEAGSACPTTVAINNAAAGTENSIWTGECTQADPERTGLAIGAWVPAEGGSWRMRDELGAARVGLYLGNWALAEGPYGVTWDNVVVRGRLDESLPTSSGTGFLHPFGTGESEREPIGRWAAFSYFATGGDRGAARAMFRYRTAGFEVASDQAAGVSLGPGRVTLWGPARVNGQSGYRYEFRGVDAGGDEADSLELTVWGPILSTRPHFAAFGSVGEGGIEVRARQGS